jgi:hypothetical protein
MLSGVLRDLGQEPVSLPQSSLSHGKGRKDDNNEKIRITSTGF